MTATTISNELKKIIQFIDIIKEHKEDFENPFDDIKNTLNDLTNTIIQEADEELDEILEMDKDNVLISAFKDFIHNLILEAGESEEVVSFARNLIESMCGSEENE